MSNAVTSANNRQLTLWSDCSDNTCSHKRKEVSEAEREKFNHLFFGDPLHGLATANARITKEKKFHTGWDNIHEKLILVISEVSESVEALRDGEICQFREEIADVYIRLFDICGSLGIDIDEEVQRKMAINSTRPDKHGRLF